MKPKYASIVLGALLPLIGIANAHAYQSCAVGSATTSVCLNWTGGYPYGYVWATGGGFTIDKLTLETANGVILSTDTTSPYVTARWHVGKYGDYRACGWWQGRRNYCTPSKYLGD